MDGEASIGEKFLLLDIPNLHLEQGSVNLKSLEFHLLSFYKDSFSLFPPPFPKTPSG